MWKPPYILLHLYLAVYMRLELLYILYIFIKYETFASIMLEKGSSQYTYNLVTLLNFRFMYILNVS